jgi:hypothetical protein
MAGRQTADAENREQHNHGSGTFVGGNVHGGIWHIFLPPYSKKPSSKKLFFKRSGV